MAGDAGHTACQVALRRLIASAARQRVVLAARLGVAPPDLLALEAIARAGELSPSDVARVLAVTSSGATTVVRRLEAAGLVSREPTGRQRRVRLQATREGDRIVAEALIPVGGAASVATDRELLAVARYVHHVADELERDAVRLTRETSAASAAAAGIPTVVRWG